MSAKLREEMVKAGERNWSSVIFFFKKGGGDSGEVLSKYL